MIAHANQLKTAGSILLLNFLFLFSNLIIYQFILPATVNSKFIFTLINFTYFVFFIYFIPLGLFVSKEYGAHALTHLSYLIKNSFLFILPISILALLISNKAPANLVTEHLSFIQLTLWGVFPLLGIFIWNQFFIGIGRIKIPLIINSAILPLFFLGAYFGSQANGLQGVICAQVGYLFLNFFLLTLYCFYKEDIRACLLRMFQRKLRRSHFKIKKFLIFQSLCEVLVLAGFGWLISRHTYMLDLAQAIPVSINVLVFILIFVFSIMQFFGVSAAQFIGYKRLSLANAYIENMLILSLLNFILIGYLYKNAPLFLFSFEFTEAIPLLTLMCVFLWLGGVVRYVGITRSLLSQAEVASPAIQSACFWLISVPLIYVLCVLGHWGALGMLLGFSAGLIANIWIVIKTKNEI